MSLLTLLNSKFDPGPPAQSGMLTLSEKQALDQFFTNLLPLAQFRRDAIPDSISALLDNAVPPSNNLPSILGAPAAGTAFSSSRSDHSHGWGVQAGAAIASAATIAPFAGVHHVTGTAAINTITPPYAGFTGSIRLIPDGLWTLATGGNIALASTAVVSRALTVTFDGTSWYPSY